MSDSFNPVDSSLPGSFVHGIPQTRILNWFAIPFSTDLPDAGIEPRFPALQADCLPSESQGSYSILWMHQKLLTDSPVNRHLGCFLFGVVMNQAAINFHIQIFVWTYLHFLWINTKELNCRVIWYLFVSSYKRLPKPFYKVAVPVCITSSFYQQCVRVLVAPHPHQHLILSSFSNLRRFNRCLVVFSCGLNFHLLNYKCVLLHTVHGVLKARILKWFAIAFSSWKRSMDSMKMQKDMTLKDELSRSVCAQYATGEEWRNNSKKKEEMEPK